MAIADFAFFRNVDFHCRVKAGFFVDSSKAMDIEVVAFLAIKDLFSPNCIYSLFCSPLKTSSRRFYVSDFFKRSSAMLEALFDLNKNANIEFRLVRDERLDDFPEFICGRVQTIQNDPE